MSAMSDRGFLRRMLGFGLLGVAAMTVLVPGILLTRNTTGHDWYAAGRLTLEEAKLAVGFSEFTKVAFRRADGDEWSLHRMIFVQFGPPLHARQRILSEIGNGMMLGGGIGGTVFCLMVLGTAGHVRRVARVASVRAVPVTRPWRAKASPGVAGRLAGRLGLGRARVALLVVSETDFEEMADLDNVVDLAELPSDGGSAKDAAGGDRTLPTAPPQAPAGANGGEDFGDAGATSEAPDRNRRSRHGRWA